MSTRILYCKEIVMIYFNDQQALTTSSIDKVNFILPCVVYWTNYTVNCSFRVSKSTDSPCYRPPTNGGKVIFSQVSVILFRGWVCLVPSSFQEWGLCLSQKPSRGGYARYIHQEGTHTPVFTPPGRYTQPVLTSSDGHQSSRYQSYWNAVLVDNLLSLPMEEETASSV